MGASLCDSLEQLISSMVVQVSKHFMIERREIMGWYWMQMQRYYVQCSRMEWQAFISDIQTQEIAISRSVGALLSGKKAKPMPDHKDTSPLAPSRAKRKPLPMNLNNHLARGFPIPDEWDVSEYQDEHGNWHPHIQAIVDMAERQALAEHGLIEDTPDE